MRLSKMFYLGSILGAPLVAIALMILGFVGAFGSAMAMQKAKPEEAAAVMLTAMAGTFGLAMLCFFYGLVIQLMLMYKVWSVIQDGHARTTPGKAAGFMLIPFFNLYWMFQVFYGYAQDYNKYIVRHAIRVPALDEKLFLFLPISILCGFVPIVNALAGLVTLVLSIIVASKMIDSVNALADTPPPLATAGASV